jgi:hypothetical protein
LGYLAVNGETFLEAGTLLQDFAGAVLVGPEVGFGDLSLKLIEQTLLAVRVKETSARLRFGF